MTFATAGNWRLEINFLIFNEENPWLLKMKPIYSL